VEGHTVPQRHSEDAPWNDVAADSGTMSTDPEPDPAEVVGDEDDEAVRDAAAHRVPDPYEKYRQETLDQRLAEEEPDVLRRSGDPEAGDLETAVDEDDFVGVGERDEVDLGEENEDDEDAEDEAIHVRPGI
jgi:hypothetical protein